MLLQHNTHPRDKNIRAKPNGGYEIIGDDRTYTRVTTFCSSLSSEPKFDAAKTIAGMKEKPTWNENNPYFHMTDKEIEKKWSDIGDESRIKGNELHKWIEDYMNGEPVGPRDDPGWVLFLEFDQNHTHLTPWRTEWMIYDENALLAGRVDMVYKKEDGTFAIYDWKRSKHYTKEEYIYQLNTYRTIIERNYDMVVSELRIVRLHPNWATYEVVNVPLLDERMKALFSAREG